VNWDNRVTVSNSAFTLSTGKVRITNCQTGLRRYDDIRIRKYTSIEPTVTVETNTKPIATIDSITPDPATQGTDTVTFTGSGDDTDGTIAAYEWTSDIDGELSTSATFTKSASELSVGTHTITLRVQDDDLAWSDPVTEDLTINAGGSSTTTYDFSNGAGSDKWAYGYEVNYYVECSDANPNDDITSSEYNQIAGDDNSYFDSEDLGLNDRAAIRYEIDISEEVADITDFSVTWNGYRGGSYEYDIGLYIWNHNLGVYELLELGTGTSEFTLTGSKTADIGNYIDGDGDLVFLTYYFDTSERFYTNYVGVEVSYTG
ncbi:MAG: hypothetical protein SVM80_11790, partial [Halobacteriota archaeon]|nr:hypothetical protein [Halobacteriota archaeon]